MMISKPRRLLALAPVVFSLMLFDIPAEIGPAIVGIFLFGIPYWLAWWLSDGFASVKLFAPNNENPYQQYFQQQQHYLGGTGYIDPCAKDLCEMHGQPHISNSSHK